MTVERGSLAVDDPWVDEVTVAVHRPTRPRGAAVLLTHGAGGDLDTPHLVTLAAAIAAHGHVVVRADQPWRAAGRAAPPPPHRAVPGYRAVAAAARAAHGPRRPWILGGHSNGGRIATHAVVGEGAATADGLLLVSYPLHRPGHPEDLRVEHWPDVPVPALVLQGSADGFGSADEVRAVLHLLPAGSVVVEVAGAGHGFAVPARRSDDGRRHEPADVGATLGGEVAAWIAADRAPAT